MDRGGTAIELIVHYPATPEAEAELDRRAAKLHAQYVAQYVDQLQCPTGQKLKLIDAVANSILERSRQQDARPFRS